MKVIIKWTDGSVEEVLADSSTSGATDYIVRSSDWAMHIPKFNVKLIQVIK